MLLYFRTQEMELVEADPAPFWDKVPARFAGFRRSRSSASSARAWCRARSCAAARYIGKDVVLMPSFVNIGAHVGAGTMVDTWATVGSCAQIGKHCHLSGGAGIGGVLEPLQATPTIIEDHCFIGARSEVVEGVIVGHHSVIGMGVFLGQSHPHLQPRDRRGQLRLRAAGQRRGVRAAAGEGRLHSLYCAVIVKQVDAKTRSKTQHQRPAARAGGLTAAR